MLTIELNDAANQQHLFAIEHAIRRFNRKWFIEKDSKWNILNK